MKEATTEYAVFEKDTGKRVTLLMDYEWAGIYLQDNQDRYPETEFEIREAENQ